MLEVKRKKGRSMDSFATENLLLINQNKRVVWEFSDPFEVAAWNLKTNLERIKRLFRK